MTTSCVYLWILRSFSDHLFYRAPLGNCLFHLQVAEIQHPHIVKSALTVKRVISASQAFILEVELGVHVLKIPKKCLWRS